PVATTAPVVSIVPPIHAPATSGASPTKLASGGMKIIIGNAMMSTRLTTYDSFLPSPCMAPHVAMAAETPQIETALEIMIPNSSSILNFLASQYVKYHTTTTTTSAWMRPSEPACMTSPKIIP